VRVSKNEQSDYLSVREKRVVKETLLKCVSHGSGTETSDNNICIFWQ